MWGRHEECAGVNGDPWRCIGQIQLDPQGMRALHSVWQRLLPMPISAITHGGAWRAQRGKERPNHTYIKCRLGRW